MTFLTGLALRRRSVTMLMIIMVLIAGVITYRGLERELFPQIEFPNILITTFFPSANPETVEREVTEPIEEAIDGMQGLKEIQSVSSEKFSFVQLTFDFGEDMKEAERTVESNVNGISFPDAVDDPVVSRINTDTFPVIQLSVTGDRDIPSLQRIVDNIIVPQIDRTDGVFEVSVLGEVDEQVTVTVDTHKLEDLGLSMTQVSNAIRDNNISFPAGSVDKNGSNFPIRATHEFGSLEDIRNLTVGFEQTLATGIPTQDTTAGPGGAPTLSAGVQPQGTTAGLRGKRAILLRDVAEVELGTE